VCDWASIVNIGIVATTVTVITIFGSRALSRIGVEAFRSGSNPEAPTAFTGFALQTVRIAAIALIVLATIILAAIGKLNEGAVGILSGIAGYVLGGAQLKSTNAQPNNATQPTPPL
jgi:hypothetical protein